MSTLPTYCIDTSSILEARTRSYPPTIFRMLWGQIETLIQSGRLVAPDQMLKELAQQADEAWEWAKAQNGLFVPLDPRQTATVTRILTTHPLLVDSSKGRSGGDPFLVALAFLNGYTVVTEEKASRSPKKPKIPDVCQAYSLRCITFLDLVIAEQWTF